jgi:hypothetical protein
VQPSIGNVTMSAGTEPKRQDDELEAAIDEAIVTSGGDMRVAIRALIIANDYLESEVKELAKAVSRAYVRGRFKTYTG